MRFGEREDKTGRWRRNFLKEKGGGSGKAGLGVLREINLFHFREVVS
jgi:hypothetical protein